MEVGKEKSCFGRNKFQKRDFFKRILLLQVRYNGDFAFSFLRELGFDVECADSFYFISKEIDTIGIFKLKRNDVDNAATYRELPWFIYKIHSGESIFCQHADYKIGIDPFSGMEG